MKIKNKYISNSEIELNISLILFTILEIIALVYFSSILIKDWEKPALVKDCFSFIVLGEIGFEFYTRLKNKN